MNQDKLSRFWVVGVAAVTALGFALRAYGIDGPSFKIWDDFFGLRVAEKSYADILHFLAHQPYDPYQEFQPPLYYLIVHALLELGRTDAMARMTGVLAGTLTIPALYCLGRTLFGRGAGLCAALLMAVSVYHIEYSQQIRNYVLFLLFATWSMYYFAAWLVERRMKGLWLYCVVTVVMLYTSYMASVVIMAQVLIWVVFTFAEFRIGLRSALKRQVPFMAAMIMAGVCYLPWFPRQSRMYSVLSQITGNTNPPIWDTLLGTVREFSSYYCETLGYPEVAVPFMLLAGIGIILAFRKRRSGAIFLLLWVAVTLLVVFGFNRQGLHVRTRHLIALLPVLFLFLGFTLSWGVAFLRGPWKSVAAVLAAVTLLNVYNFRVLPFYYRREDDRLKDLCYTLGTFKRDTDRLMFWGSDSKWFPSVSHLVQDWYLPGVFHGPGQDFSRQYMRAWMLSSPAARPVLAGMENVLPQGRRAYVDYSLVGLVNTSPVTVDFGIDGAFELRQDFRSPNAYSLVHELENLEFDNGSVRTRSIERSGYIEYAFELPQGSVMSSMRAEVAATFLADVSGVPDSAVTVSAAGPTGDFSPLARFPMRELAAAPGFNGRQVELRGDVPVPSDFCRDGLRVRLELDPGKEWGAIMLSGVVFSAKGSSQVPPQATPERRRLDHALNNSLIAPADGGAIPLGQPLFAFTTKAQDAQDPARIGGAQALAAFQKAYSGLKPVLSVVDGDARYFLYDPALGEPSLGAPGEYAVTGGPVRSVVVWGRGDAGIVSVADQRAGLASAGQVQVFQDMDALGQGRLVMTPTFSSGNPSVAGAVEAPGVKQHPGEDCLTCVDAKPCYMVYKLSAPGGFTDITVQAYPRVFGDWFLANRWRVSVSTDGSTFEPLDGLRSNASGRWDGWRVPRTSRKVWALPARDIYIRFDFSGDGVQLWSSSEFPLLIEAGFAGPGGEFPNGPFALGAQGVSGRFQALTTNARHFKHLLRPY